MPGLIIVIIILGIAIGVFTFFLIKSFVAPKRVASLANLIKQEKYTQATKMAKQILTREPRSADAHYFLGLAYMGELKPELALMELKTVNQIGNFTGFCKEVPFRQKIADLYAKFNQTEEALKEYLLLIKRQPFEAEHYYRTGLLFEERHRSDKAAEFYRKAIEIDARHGNSHYRLGVLLYKSKKPVEARKELEEAIRYNQENFPAFFYLGRLQKENHDYVAALVAFEKAQKDLDFKTKSLVERGACYMSMNNFERAVSELERAVKLSNDESSSEVLFGRYFLSICYEKTRRIELAIEQWEKIYQKKPAFKDVAEKLSQYQEFRQDDHVKDFLISGHDEFIETCKSVTAVMGLSISDVTSIPNGCQIIGAEAETKWRNARKMPKIIRFLRVAEMIDESSIRSLHEEMKKQNIMRGVIVTSSNFSRLAMDFAETRPIDLLDKERLQELLKKAETESKSKTT